MVETHPMIMNQEDLSDLIHKHKQKFPCGIYLKKMHVRISINLSSECAVHVRLGSYR